MLGEIPIHHRSEKNFVYFCGTNPPEVKVNTLLWFIQIVLGIKFLSVAFSHGLRQGQEKMQAGIQRIGSIGRPLLYAIAVCTFLGGIGLIVPVALRVPAGWTPITAALLAGLMLLSIAGHTACQDKPKIWVSLILFALAAFLAYGRWILVP
jgi:hypothetical protein